MQREYKVDQEALNKAVVANHFVGYKPWYCNNGTHLFCFLTVDSYGNLVSANLCPAWEFCKFGWKIFWHGLRFQLTKRTKL